MLSRMISAFQRKRHGPCARTGPSTRWSSPAKGSRTVGAHGVAGHVHEGTGAGGYAALAYLQRELAVEDVPGLVEAGMRVRRWTAEAARRDVLVEGVAAVRVLTHDLEGHRDAHRRHGFALAGLPHDRLFACRCRGGSSSGRAS